jgi:hypothetical protein
MYVVTAIQVGKFIETEAQSEAEAFARAQRLRERLQGEYYPEWQAECRGTGKIERPGVSPRPKSLTGN